MTKVTWSEYPDASLAALPLNGCFMPSRGYDAEKTLCACLDVYRIRRPVLWVRELLIITRQQQ